MTARSTIYSEISCSISKPLVAIMFCGVRYFSTMPFECKYDSCVINWKAIEPMLASERHPRMLAS